VVRLAGDTSVVVCSSLLSSMQCLTMYSYVGTAWLATVVFAAPRLRSWKVDYAVGSKRGGDDGRSFTLVMWMARDSGVSGASAKAAPRSHSRGLAQG
jgi:hypothetical protein